MKTIAKIALIATVALAGCTSSTTTETVPCTDSTAVKCDSTKCCKDSTAVADTTKK